VGKVRWNATMTQNVVMYTVEVEADNSKNILLPYLTAKVQFEVQKQTDTLIAPNAALRWNPASTSELPPDMRDAMADGKGEQSSSGPDKKSSTQSAGGAKPKVHRGTIWVQDGAYVRPMNVTLGTSDGINTSISGDGLHEGLQVVASEAVRSAEASQRSPFLPQMIRR
jgi:HlyD family secretion protein